MQAHYAQRIFITNVRTTAEERVIHKQSAKVSGMYDFPNSSYSAKGITENLVWPSQ